MSRMCPTFHTMSAVRATFSHQVTLHEKCSTLKKKKIALSALNSVLKWQHKTK